MNVASLLSATFLLTLVLSVFLPVLVKPLLVKLHIIDVPNERSSHERPVIRGLGLAVLLAMVVGYAVGFWQIAQVSSSQQSQQVLLWVTLAALASALLGLGEDLRGVSVTVRSILLLAIAIGVAIGLMLLTGAAWWFAIYAVLFVSGYINVANFMDGLNGISGFHGIIAGATFAIAGVLSELPWLIVAGAVLAAGFAGFLPWNLTKPGAFLGDVGSYLLGGAVATTSLFAVMNGVPILASIGPMIIYFGDVAVTLVKRVRAGHKWYEPHREHVYEQLQQMGFSHVQASGITALFTMIAAGLGLLSYAVEPILWLVLLAAGLALVVIYVRLPRILRHRDTPGLH